MAKPRLSNSYKRLKLTGASLVGWYALELVALVIRKQRGDTTAYSSLSDLITTDARKAMLARMDRVRALTWWGLNKNTTCRLSSGSAVCVQPGRLFPEFQAGGVLAPVGRAGKAFTEDVATPILSSL
jgi:hypothetical protein